MHNFTVWVDADSFPVKARTFLVNLSASNCVPVVFVANHEIKFQVYPTSDVVKMVLCEKEKDSADNYIFSHCGDNDIVVTRDIVFASRLVNRKVAVMNDRGLLFSSDNIKDKLREREFSLNMSEIGFGGNKANYYGTEELRKFSALFESELRKHIMISMYNIKRW